MDHKELTAKCSDLLNWTDHKISRTRPIDMKHALEDYSRTVKIEKPVMQIDNVLSLPDEQENQEKQKIPIIQFNRFNRPVNSMPQISTISPKLCVQQIMPTTTTTTTTAMFDKSNIKSILINSDVSKLKEHVQYCLNRISSIFQRKDSKTRLLEEKQNELDLCEHELLYSSIEQDTRQLKKYTMRISYIKTEIEKSLKRKNTLLLILDETDFIDSENDEDEVNLRDFNQNKLNLRITDLKNILQTIKLID
jgi:hypothetical protein